jgi:hypothetical protein
MLYVCLEIFVRACVCMHIFLSLCVCVLSCVTTYKPAKAWCYSDVTVVLQWCYSGGTVCVSHKSGMSTPQHAASMSQRQSAVQLSFKTHTP